MTSFRSNRPSQDRSLNSIPSLDQKMDKKIEHTPQDTEDTDSIAGSSATGVYAHG